MAGHRSVMVLAAAALMTCGCDVRVPHPEMDDPPTLTLRVTNEGQYDVDIYAVNGWFRQRIVHVCGKGRADVEIGEPWLGFGEIVIFADAVESEGTYMTPPITVVGETQIDLTLRDEVTRSTYRVHYDYGLEEIETEEGEVP